MNNFRLAVSILALTLLAFPAQAVVVSVSGSPSELTPSTPAVFITYTSSTLVPPMSIVSGGICTNALPALRGGGIFTNPGLVCSPPLIGTATPGSITSTPQTRAETLGGPDVNTAAGVVGHGGIAWFIRGLTDGVINQSAVIPVRVYSGSALSISTSADNVTLDATASATINVKSNDAVGGRVADSFNSVASIVSSANLIGLTLDGAAGTLNIPSGQFPGIFDVIYSLCQSVTQTSNCQNGTLTVTVNGSIQANPDSATMSGAGGAIDVLLNDTANGSTASSSNVSLSLVGNGGLTGIATSGGRLLIPSGVAAGNYSLSYRICLLSNPSQCSTASISLTITTISVIAASDSASVSSSGGIIDILANDQISGQPATISNADVTITANAGIAAAALDAQGRLVIPANVTAGNYSLQYRLCQRGTSNCATTTVALAVSQATSALLARDDRASVPLSGGSFSVIGNDTLNNRAVVASEVSLSLTSNGGIAGLSVTTSGNLVIPGGASASNYIATYSICQRSSPNNCSSARVFIAVVANIVDVTPNRPPSVPGGLRTTTVTIPGPSGSPITFATSSSGTSAGAINDPLTFSAIKLVFGTSENGPVQAFYKQSDIFGPYGAQLYYSGSGLLRARWEVVLPGDPLPTELDLFPEASLPAELRASQQRFLLQDRVQVFLPPLGRIFINGPDPARLPRNLPGEYLILLRIETSPGASGLEGGRAPFALPVLSYRLQESERRDPLRGEPASVNQFSSLGELPTGGVRLASSTFAPAPIGEGLVTLALNPISLTLPQEGASIAGDRPVTFSWADVASVNLYRIEVQSATGTELFSALAKPGMGSYAMPPPIRETLPIGQWVRWRVTGRTDGKVIAASEWRGLRLE